MKKILLLGCFLTTGLSLLQAGEREETRSKLPRKVLMKIAEDGQVEAYEIPKDAEVSSEIDAAKLFAAAKDTDKIQLGEEIPAELDKTTSKSGWGWTTTYASVSVSTGSSSGGVVARASSYIYSRLRYYDYRGPVYYVPVFYIVRRVSYIVWVSW